MAGITLADAEARLAQWLEADAAVASNQSYTVQSPAGGGRTLTRADSGEIRRNIDYWNGWCVRLGGTALANGIRVTHVVPA
ncbi:hypothetical protein H261_03273 [Paramagnetospirillum caucaseum]|uniref:Uncharacterized protein n=1 Tax=Paramagnetospirillum caucaseum TaxID=1244869 RepID=M2ZVH1_9PROT|nr:DUF6148 family protein [Paramagnetospirillum caucaseum]EME71397.1 hypothetical protein H261_03273 [Paramagnetospirillum caucaseum]